MAEVPEMHEKNHLSASETYAVDSVVLVSDLW